MERNICDGYGPEYTTYGMIRQKPISTSEEKCNPPLQLEILARIPQKERVSGNYETLTFEM